MTSHDRYMWMFPSTILNDVDAFLIKGGNCTRMEWLLTSFGKWEMREEKPSLLKNIPSGDLR